GNAKSAQIRIINTLGSPDFMDTETRNGTGVPKLMRGFEKFVKDCGYQIEHMEYRGWARAPRSLKPTNDLPTIDWMQEYVAHPLGTAWLNIGWYKFDAETKTYQRTGGHWITLVGYGVDENGQPDK